VPVTGIEREFVGLDDFECAPVMVDPPAVRIELSPVVMVDVSSELPSDLIRMRSETRLLSDSTIFA
jgi:hypothetical protein